RRWSLPSRQRLELRLQLSDPLLSRGDGGRERLVGVQPLLALPEREHLLVLGQFAAQERDVDGHAASPCAPSHAPAAAVQDVIDRGSGVTIPPGGSAATKHITKLAENLPALTL